MHAKLMIGIAIAIALGCIEPGLSADLKTCNFKGEHGIVFTTPQLKISKLVNGEFVETDKLPVRPATVKLELKLTLGQSVSGPPSYSVRLDVQGTGILYLFGMAIRDTRDVPCEEKMCFMPLIDCKTAALKLAGETGPAKLCITNSDNKLTLSAGDKPPTYPTIVLDTDLTQFLPSVDQLIMRIKLRVTSVDSGEEIGCFTRDIPLAV